MGLGNESSESMAYADVKSRFEEAEAQRNAHRQNAMQEIPEELRMVPKPLNGKLKKSGLTGYRRSSVEEYVEELNRSTDQLRDSMERQIQRLSRECMRLKSEGTILREQISQAEERNSEVTEQLERVSAERDDAERRAAQAGTELREMEEKLRLYEEGNARAEERLAALEQKAEDLNDAESENEWLRNQLREYSEKIGVISEEFSRMKNSASISLEEYSEMKLCIESLQTTNRSLEDELELTRRKLHELETARISRFGADTDDELIEKYAALFEQYKKAIARGESLEAEKDAIAGLLEEYQEKEREAALLRMREEEQRAAIEELQNVINVLLDEMQKQLALYDRLSGELRDNKDLVCSLSKDKSELQRQNVELQIQNVELLDRNENLNGRLSQVQGDRDRLSDMVKQNREPQFPGTVKLPDSVTLPATIQKPSAAAPAPLPAAGDSGNGLEEKFNDTMKKVRQIGSLYK